MYPRSVNFNFALLAQVNVFFNHRYFAENSQHPAKLTPAG
jgi:hypothetical protein